MLSSTFVSWRQRISGCCSAIAVRRAQRARTELMFQEAILIVGMAMDVATLGNLRAERKKAPAPGAWSEGRPSVVTQGSRSSLGNRGKPRAPTDRFLLAVRP